MNVPTAAPGQKERKDLIERKQRNGTTYVYERTSVYDSKRKFYVPVSHKLIGKKLPGSNQVIPTRPKSPKGSLRKAAAVDPPAIGDVSATRIQYGASQIVARIGEASGIDDDIMRSCTEAIGKKIIALARYYFMSDGESTSRVEKWQLMHILAPYNEFISEDTAHKLFDTLTANESIRQNIFFYRASHLTDKTTLAYDSTTISTYGKSHGRARYGYNKAKDGLKTDKLFTFYSMETRQPICFYTAPGNIPDVSGIESAMKQLKVLGLKNVEITTDSGFYSEENLSLMLQYSYHFITRVSHTLRWIRPEVDKALQSLEDTGNMSPDEPGTYGVTICLKHEFTKIRKRGSEKNGIKVGDPVQFTRRIYVHIFFNDINRIKDNLSLDRDLNELRTLYLEGQREFDQPSQNMIDKFLIIKAHRNGNVDIQFNTSAIRDEKKYNGVFVLVSDKEKDTFSALRKYRKREWIEDFFEAYKQRTGDSKHHTWTDFTTDGRKLVKFVALSYYEYFSRMINEIKDTLGKKTGDRQHDTKKNLARENALKSWLNNTSIHEILDWFDAVERVEVISPYAREKWTTDVIERDTLFLEKLGVKFE